MAFSDRRLKEDIKPIGKLDNGLQLYSYKYIGQERTHVGVMADEVQKVIPDAVHENEAGFLMVDYEKVISHV